MKKIQIVCIIAIFIGFFNSCSTEEFLNDVILDDTVSDDMTTDDASEPDNPSSEITLTEFTFNKTEGPDKNPLKGWNSGWWNDSDYATVGFQYIKWKDFESTNGTFNFDAIEEVLSRPGSKDRHFILRLYADWHGDNIASDGGPDWLYDEIGVARLQSSNGRYLTDFNDEKYIKQAIEAIAALANHYDDDPRVYAFQLGVLGYWGEWHTFGYDDDYDISDTSANQILNAYKTSFTRSQLMGRYPWRDPLSETGGIGYHNDFFGPVGHSDEFDDAIFADAKWLEGPIGGEMPPGWGATEYNEMFSTPKGMSMVKTGHYSTMKPTTNPCDDAPNSENCAGFMSMHRKMGYNYQIEKAIFPKNLTQADEFSIQLMGNNIGVAPIYYNWDVQFALIDENEQAIKVFKVDYDLTTILQNSAFYISTAVSVNDVDKGMYTVGVRIIQPKTDDTKANAWRLAARNTYILFSNEVPVLDGVWNGDNALSGGWSILGNVTLE